MEKNDLNKYDLMIKGGHIIDGTGNPYYKADIAITDGKIVLIENVLDDALAQQVIRADGLAVSPGFIDAHSHDDLYLLIKPACDEKILQGVTTTVIGNCGFSAAPVSENHRKDFEDFLKVMGGKYIPKEDLVIRSMHDYLGKLQSKNLGINVLPLVGHSTVRAAVMGSANRAPTNSELEKMKASVADAMNDGAWGISTGLIYAPGNYAETDEIIELCKVVNKYGGIYTSHIRDEGDHQISALTEAIKIGQQSGVPVHISHHKTMGKNNRGKSVNTLKMMAEARNRGIDVTCDQYPYRASSTYLASVLPPDLMADGPEMFAEKLKDRKIRASVKAEIEKDKNEEWENSIKGTGIENIFIAMSPNHPNYIGKSITDIAKMENKNSFDVIFDLVAEETRETIIILFNMDNDDIRRIMRNAFTMVGSDGIPGFGVNRVHPRFTGTFPRILGRFVREERVLRLEDAIRKMTSLPAQTFRQKRKGLLKEGLDADIVIFNPKTIIDKATYKNPQQKPEGIHYVLVNGEIAAENGKVTGATSGKVLRH